MSSVSIKKIFKDKNRSGAQKSANATHARPTAKPIITLQDAFFLVPFAVWLVVQIIEQTFFSSGILETLDQISGLCVFIIVANEAVHFRPTVKSFAGIAITALFLFFASWPTNLWMIQPVLVIYCAHSVNFRKIALVSLIVSCGTMAVVSTASLFGCIPDYVFTYYRIRHCLGYFYPLYPSEQLFMISGLWIYLRGKRFSWADAIVLICANLALFILTNAWQSFILGEVMLVVALIVSKSGVSLSGKFRGIPALLCFSFALVALLSIWMVYNYDPANAFWTMVNDGLEDRLQLGQNGLMTYGITPFGQDVSWVGYGLSTLGPQLQPSTLVYNYVDALFVQILIEYGAVFTIGLLALLTLSCVYAVKTKDPLLLTVLVFIALHCALDDLSFYIAYNQFLLLFSALLGLSFSKERSQGKQESINPKPRN